MIKALVKIGQREHLDELFKKGQLFMNTLDYFRKCEGISRDENEGTKQIMQGKRTKFVIIPQGGTPAPIKGLISAQATHSVDLKKNIFCMHAIIDNSLCFEPGHSKRASCALVIRNFPEFIKRLEATQISEGMRLSHQLVEYVDRDLYHGELGPFRKFKQYKGYDYSKESEYRILLEPGDGRVTSIFVGSLEDIAVIVDSASLASFQF